MEIVFSVTGPCATVVVQTQSKSCVTKTIGGTCTVIKLILVIDKVTAVQIVTELICAIRTNKLPPMNIDAVKEVGKYRITTKWSQELRLLRIQQYCREVFDIYNTLRGDVTTDLNIQRVVVFVVCPGYDCLCFRRTANIEFWFGT